MKILSFILVIFLNTCTSCNYIPCSSSSDLTSVLQIPNSKAISGIYKPDKFTKGDLQEYSNSDSTYLILTPDNELTYKNFPIETFKPGITNIKVNGTGAWNLILNSKTTKIETRSSFDYPDIFPLVTFRLFSKNGKYLILIDDKDPDVCRSVRLEQQ